MGARTDRFAAPFAMVMGTREEQQIIRNNSVRLCLKVFVASGVFRDDHLDGVLANVDVECPLAAFDSGDRVRLRKSPCCSIGIGAAEFSPMRS